MCFLNVPALGKVANYRTAYFLTKIKFLAKRKRELTTKIRNLAKRLLADVFFIFRLLFYLVQILKIFQNQFLCQELFRENLYLSNQ